MKNLIQKYTGFIRNFRLVHYLYNLWHRKGLKHEQTFVSIF